MPQVTALDVTGGAVAATNDQTNRQTDSSVATAQAAPAPEPQDPRFEALAKREKQLRAQQQKFLSEKQEWERSRTQSSNDQSRAQMEAKWKEEFMSRLQEDPMVVVSEIGEKLRGLEDSHTKAQRLLEEQQKNAETQARNQISNNVRILMETDSAGDYEAIRTMGAHDAVTELIHLSILEGQEMSTREAAKEVEAYLIDEAMKAAAITKVRSKLTPKEKSETETQQSQKSTTTTLTNQQSGQSKQLTSKDRIARAKLRAKGIDPDTGKPVGQS